MTDIVILGGGGHAKVVISVLKKLNCFQIVGYTDKVDRGEILGERYLGDDDVLQTMVRKFPRLNVAVGIGMVEVSALRRNLIKKVSGYGCVFPPIVSPQAVVNENVSLSDGCIVLDGAVVNTGTSVGMGAILNTNSTVEHDCRIGDYVHIASGATLSGGVEVESNSFIGAGATIIQYKKICENCLIGAGSVVIDDLKEQGTYVGIPARRITK